MLEEIKERVFRANLDLKKNGLVIFTWGNVSEIDRKSGLIVIKPSGVEYENMKPSDMCVVDLSGNTVDGALRPSSDTPTHIELYKAFPALGGITHTHSVFATSWAQAGRDIPFYGTTHADYFHGDIPCTRSLTKKEVESDYEKNTGLVISETFTARKLAPLEVPGAVVRNHGVFTFGDSAAKSVYNATVLEKVAEMALYTERINGGAEKAPQYIMDKHYNRKHGAGAYYGQETSKK